MKRAILAGLIGICCFAVMSEATTTACPKEQTFAVRTCALQNCGSLVNQSIAEMMQTGGTVSNPLGGNTASCIINRCPLDLNLFLNEFPDCVPCLQEFMPQQGLSAVDFCTTETSEPFFPFPPEYEYEYQQPLPPTKAPPPPSGYMQSEEDGSFHSDDLAWMH
jgi:hypothetical protein